MIDLTPLDVRNKRGDFRKILRGYDPEEVDAFLELIAERLEELVREGLTLGEQIDRLQEQVSRQEEREDAVHEALVTAQALRQDVQEQARKESELLLREAEIEVGRIVEEAERHLEERRSALEEMERFRQRFLRSFRSLLERELDAVEVEEARKPLEDLPLEIDFTVGELRDRVGETSLEEEGAEGLGRGEPGDEDGEGPPWLSSVLKEERGSRDAPTDGGADQGDILAAEEEERVEDAS